MYYILYQVCVTGHSSWYTLFNSNTLRYIITMYTVRWSYRNKIPTQNILYIILNSYTNLKKNVDRICKDMQAKVYLSMKDIMPLWVCNLNVRLYAMIYLRMYTYEKSIGNVTRCCSAYHTEFPAVTIVNFN